MDNLSGKEEHGVSKLVRTWIDVFHIGIDFLNLIDDSKSEIGNYLEENPGDIFGVVGRFLNFWPKYMETIDRLSDFVDQFEVQIIKLFNIFNHLVPLLLVGLFHQLYEFLLYTKNHIFHWGRSILFDCLPRKIL